MFESFQKLSWKRVSTSSPLLSHVIILSLSFAVTTLFLDLFFQMCSFLVPHLSLVTYLSFVAHSLQATAEGHFLTTIHCSSTSTRHSAKDKQLQSERSPCLSPSSVFCQQETIKELFRDRTSPTILINWHFSMFICQNH